MIAEPGPAGVLPLAEQRGYPSEIRRGLARRAPGGRRGPALGFACSRASSLWATRRFHGQHGEVGEPGRGRWCVRACPGGMSERGTLEVRHGGCGGICSRRPRKLTGEPCMGSCRRWNRGSGERGAWPGLRRLSLGRPCTSVCGRTSRGQGVGGTLCTPPVVVMLHDARDWRYSSPGSFDVVAAAVNDPSPSTSRAPGV